MLIRTCSPFWFDLLSTEYPQRLAPHCSIRTLPSFSSVNQTPSGEFAACAAAGGGAGRGFLVDVGAGVGGGGVEGVGDPPPYRYRPAQRWRSWSRVRSPGERARERRRRERERERGPSARPVRVVGLRLRPAAPAGRS